MGRAGEGGMGAAITCLHQQLTQLQQRVQQLQQLQQINKHLKSISSKHLMTVNQPTVSANIISINF